MAARWPATAHGEGILQANGTLAREKLLRNTMKCKTYALAADVTQHGSHTLTRMSQMIDRRSSDLPENEWRGLELERRRQIESSESRPEIPFFCSL